MSNLPTENTSLNKNVEDIYICGLNMSKLSSGARLSFSIAGIFVLYVCYGALQEAIFTSNDMRSYSLFLTLYQFGIYSAIAYFELRARNTIISKSLLGLYCFLALLTMGTISFSNAAVGYLNYPTQVIFKCCKMIPVLIGGILIQGNRYSVLEILAVVLMTLGLIFFTLVDVSIQPTFTFFGVILVTCALCCDGALGNFQEMAMKKFGCSNTEILFYSYTVGCAFLITGLTVSATLVPAFRYFNHHPMKTYGLGFLFSISGYFGMQFVLCLVHSHGALTAVTVTTFRKAVSIILSFILFKKPFSQGYIWSGLLVVAGLYLNLYNKNRNSWNPRIKDFLSQLRVKRSNTPTLLPL